MKWHIHAKYQGEEAVIAIPDGELIEGSLPPGKMRCVTDLNSDEAGTAEQNVGRGVAVTVRENGELIGRDPVNIVVRANTVPGCKP